jgi:cell division protein FtsN
MCDTALIWYVCTKLLRSRRRSKKHGPKTAKTNPNELTDIQRKVFEQMQIEAAYEAMKKNREAPDLINTTTEATKQQAAAAAAQPAGVAPKQPYTPPAAAPQQAEVRADKSLDHVEKSMVDFSCHFIF